MENLKDAIKEFCKQCAGQGNFTPAQCEDTECPLHEHRPTEEENDNG